MGEKIANEKNAADRCSPEGLPVHEYQNSPNQGKDGRDWQGKSPPEDTAHRK